LSGYSFGLNLLNVWQYLFIVLSHVSLSCLELINLPENLLLFDRAQGRMLILSTFLFDLFLQIFFIPAILRKIFNQILFLSIKYSQSFVHILQGID
jgi:hypothetical protein